MRSIDKRNLLAGIATVLASSVLPSARSFAQSKVGNELTSLTQLPMDRPNAPVIAIGNANKNSLSVSRQDLAALKQTKLTTHMPWTETVHDLEGPSIGVIVETYAGMANPTMIIIEALDGFAVTAPINEMEAGGAILAIRQGGQFLPISRRGPAFVMFPFDGRPDPADRVRSGRCIWQISRIAFS